MEVKGKIVCKKSDNKAFKLGNDWYNVNAPVIPYLEKIDKGEPVIVTYEKKGMSRYVSKIIKASNVEEEPKSTEESPYKCEDCGAPLKDDKYKKCYKCNKGLTKKSNKSSNTENTKEKPSHYYNEDRTAQIQRGNALNAAAMVASSQQFADPDAAGQFTKLLADDLLEWLRAE